MDLTYLYPICKLGSSILLVRKDDLPFVGKGLGVMSVKVDFSTSEFFDPVDLEIHLKFNPWEEIFDSRERENYIVLIQKQFQQDIINEQIINPLFGIMEKIYVSALLKNNQDFYSMLSNRIHDKRLELVELENTKDIWCRDYMPVKSATGKNLLFNYDPAYLKGEKWKCKLTPRRDLIKLLNNFQISFEPVDDILLEGGNVIRYGDKVIMTDAIYRENKIDKDIKGQSALNRRLEKLLESQLIIIPHQPDDTLGHADGVVRFLDHNTVLINDFSSAKGTKFEESKHYLDNTFGALGKAGLNILQVSYSPTDETGEDEMFAANGIYINYLETKKYVFLPQFGYELEQKDKEALEVFNKIFSKTNKQVIPVPSRTIAMKGGVLNCITWN